MSVRQMCITILITIVIYLIVINTLLAQGVQHDPNSSSHWYEMRCCSLHDCQPAIASEVKVTSFGYEVRGHVVPFSDKRIRNTLDPSDSRYHICQSPNTKDIICLYIPPSGY